MVAARDDAEPLAVVQLDRSSVGIAHMEAELFGVPSSSSPPVQLAAQGVGQVLATVGRIDIGSPHHRPPITRSDRWIRENELIAVTLVL